MNVYTGELLDNYSITVKGEWIAYVGDDPVADLQGALDAGIQPIWTHYAAIHTQRPFKELSELLGPSVPIIENWNDLFALLHGETQI